MESFLNRYRNITVLLLVIFAQLVLLAAQVKNDQDVRVIRVWAVSTVTPVARIAEWFRGGGVGFFRRYVLLHDASEENRRLREEVGRLRLENNYLHNELNTADRAKALQLFQAHTPSKLLAARVIITGVGTNANIVYVDRGSTEGVMRGMGVITPDGIVGRVINAYPTASEVMLVSDPEFSAGVVSQKSQSHGVLKGQGSTPFCRVDYVPIDDKVEVGEWFYTSGDDRVFPRGFQVGVVKAVQEGTPPYKSVLVEPSGIQHGVEDVLIVMESVHQTIPDAPPANQPVYIAPAPPAPEQSSGAESPSDAAGGAGQQGTDADKLRSIYKAAGDAQNHVFGAGLPGSKPPDFKNLPSTPGGAPATAPKNPAGASPSPRPETQNQPAGLNKNLPSTTGGAPTPAQKNPAGSQSPPHTENQGAPPAAGNGFVPKNSGAAQNGFVPKNSDSAPQGTAPKKTPAAAPKGPAGSTPPAAAPKGPAAPPKPPGGLPLG